MVRARARRSRPPSPSPNPHPTPKQVCIAWAALEAQQGNLAKALDVYTAAIDAGVITLTLTLPLTLTLTGH